ncbi:MULTISPECIES: diacylglycerol kinase family protein [unclassified Spirosoma]|uniref:diacylglycerol/lipid kinase family protein n=1 Tax=unclassified Spirosoma TaxID=2621999 RepID=UPI00095F25E7|nr:MULTISPECIES: diacylglycerol kinase family protein [unclassified Spirosoma]MBN8821901.1 diacylglycerol kinase family lipid kinase [Spirosoma sp.]OJW80616.1 MAG: diacylglycerol kinase [Spirosoma sp. 48-14]
MTFLFIINPVSGGHDKSDWEQRIDTFFADQPYTVHRCYLDGKTDSETIQKQLSQCKPDRVVAVGGDGTIKLVAEQLISNPIPLGILPGGSANGMARELGIPTDLQKSLELLVDGKPKPIDVISINDDDICLHLSDIGLNAHIVKYYEQNNLRGKLGYLRSVLNVLRKHRLLRLEIKTDDECVQRVAFMVVLANARMYGTGAVINPDGDPSDGKFEVVIFRRLSFGEILKLFWRFQPFDPKKIEIYPATSVTIETHKRAYFQIDGEYRGRITKLAAQIKPAALSVILPDDKN